MSYDKPLKTVKRNFLFYFLNKDNAKHKPQVQPIIFNRGKQSFLKVNNLKEDFQKKGKLMTFFKLGPW